MSWITTALIAIIVIVTMIILYLIFAGILAVFIGRRLAKMSVEFDEKWDELK